MDFTIIKRAGLTGRDFSRIVGATEVAASYWIRGVRAPRESSKYFPRIRRTLTLLEKWVGEGKLPKPAMDGKTATEILATRAKLVARIGEIVSNNT